MATTVAIGRIIDEQGRSSTRTWVVVLCFLVMFADGFDLNLLGYVAPALSAEYGITKSQFGWVVSAGLAGFMAGAFIFSGLGDRYGRKPMILAGVLLFGSLTLAAAYVHSLEALFFLRLVAGIGLGGAVPNAVALNAEYAPVRMRATVIGIMYVGYTLGGAAPGLVAAGLMSSYGWRVVLFAGGIFPLLLAVILFFALPESLRFLAARTAQREKLLRMLSKLRGGVPIPSDTRIVSDEEVKGGLPVKHLFTDGRAPTTLLLWLAFFSCLTGLLFIIAWTPTLLTNAGIPAERAALISAMFQTGAAIGSIVITRLVDRFGVGAVVLWLLLAIPAVAAVGQVGSVEAVLICAVFGAGFFASAGQVGMNSVAGISYPTFVRASGVGWANGIGRIGAIIGPMIGGILISGHHSVETLFVYAAVPIAVAAAAIFALWRHLSRHANPAETM